MYFIGVPGVRVFRLKVVYAIIAIIVGSGGNGDGSVSIIS